TLVTIPIPRATTLISNRGRLFMRLSYFLAVTGEAAIGVWWRLLGSIALEINQFFNDLICIKRLL
ncbi:MAG: hypothetical protein WBZ28_25800, partial [Pseudolabrys sp.]